MFRSHAVWWNSRGGPQSSPVVFVNILRLTCLPFGMCVYFFSAALWSFFQTTIQPQLLLDNTPSWPFLFRYKSQVVDLSFCLHAWTDLITCIQFSLFIQLAVCFTLPCFIYGSHVLWLQLGGEFLKGWGSFELFHRQCMIWVKFIIQAFLQKAFTHFIAGKE